jgi:hypothetical protein
LAFNPSVYMIISKRLADAAARERNREPVHTEREAESIGMPDSCVCPSNDHSPVTY